MGLFFPLFGDTYLSFRYDLDLTEQDFRAIGTYASLAHWEDTNLFADFIDLGGEG